MVFADVLPRLSAALSQPCTLYTDTTMALSGINKTLLAKFGGECRCYISDPRVVAEAKAQGMTRSMAAVDIAVAEEGEKVFVFGNAPTALFRLLEHDVAVNGVIGVPVGFVGAAESKEALTQSGLPASPRWVVKAAATSPPPSSTPFCTTYRGRDERAIL